MSGENGVSGEEPGEDALEDARVRVRELLAQLDYPLALLGERLDVPSSEPVAAICRELHAQLTPLVEAQHAKEQVELRRWASESPWARLRRDRPGDRDGGDDSPAQ